MSRQLPSRIADFIRRYISSLEQLEVLLLLSSSPERRFTVAAAYEQIRSNPDSLRIRLNQLVAHGLVQVETENGESYFYRPATPEMDAVVVELAGIYKERRISVIEHIFAEPPSPIQDFAEAFRLRRDQRDG